MTNFGLSAWEIKDLNHVFFSKQPSRKLNWKNLRKSQFSVESGGFCGSVFRLFSLLITFMIQEECSPSYLIFKADDSVIL